MEALQRQKEPQLKEWHDLWFSEYKKAGFVGITPDYKNYSYYGVNNVKQLEYDTKGKIDQFITVNGFYVNPITRRFSRESKHLKQIRNIAIDIDQYNLGLSIDEVLNGLDELILSNIIPEPNLISSSRGVQLFYTIDKGASPQMSWLTSIITEQFVGKLKHLGADSQAVDTSRLMRVPNTINSRNNKLVVPQIRNSTPFSLQELQSYCILLKRKRYTKTDNLLNTSLTLRQQINYMVNHTRLKDLRKLIELRKGDFPNMRNTLLYIYSYHQTLVSGTLDNVNYSVRARFNDVYSSVDKKQLPDDKVESTITSAYNNATDFYSDIEKHNYVFKPHSKESRTTIKPYNSNEIIEKLSITIEEQRMLKTIVSKEVRKEHEKQRMTNYRRSQGVVSREEYEQNRREERYNNVYKLIELIEIHPEATQKELAEMMNVTTRTIRNYINEINQ